MCCASIVDMLLIKYQESFAKWSWIDQISSIYDQKMRKLCLAQTLNWKRAQPLALLMDQQWLCHRSIQPRGNTIPKLFIVLLSFCVHGPLTRLPLRQLPTKSAACHIKFVFFSSLVLTDRCKLFLWMHAQIFSCYEIHFINLFWNDEREREKRRIKNCVEKPSRIRMQCSALFTLNRMSNSTVFCSSFACNAFDARSIAHTKIVCTAHQYHLSPGDWNKWRITS